MTMMLERPPTAKHLAVLRLIYETARDRGYQPSYREIDAELDLGGTNGVTLVLKALARKGYVRLPGKCSRAVVIVRRPDHRDFAGFDDGPARARPDGGPCPETFRYIYEYTRDHGYQPSVREVAGWFGLTASAAWKRLVQLGREGWLKMSTTEKRRLGFILRPDRIPFTGFVDKEP